LLLLLAVFRVSAWLAVLIGSLVTFLLAAYVWHMPARMGRGLSLWRPDRRLECRLDHFLGGVLFNTLMWTGIFDRFRRWLLAQGTADIRVQTILFAWAFARCSKDWLASAFRGPLSLDSDRAGRAPISMRCASPRSPTMRGLLRRVGRADHRARRRHRAAAPALSSSVGHIVAILALLPPGFCSISLAAGEAKQGWPLAIIGSLGYIAGSCRSRFILGLSSGYRRLHRLLRLVARAAPILAATHHARLRRQAAHHGGK